MTKFNLEVKRKFVGLADLKVFISGSVNNFV